MPRIENWFYYGDGIGGQITGHQRQDQFTSDCQWTSKVIAMNEEEGWCQTENTRYELGKRANTAVLCMGT